MQQNNHSPMAPVVHSPKRTLAYMIAGSIVISLLLVALSMWLYNMSGAAQLDLSRPGYQDVRAKAQQAEQFDGFDATGALDEESLKKFDALYKQQQSAIRKNSEGFNPFTVDNEHLGIHVE